MPKLDKNASATFITTWIKNHTTGDILDADFVQGYIEATGAAFQPTAFGALKCPVLGKELSRLFKAGVLQRSRVGISGAVSLGFPTWVYLYELAD